MNKYTELLALIWVVFQKSSGISRKKQKEFVQCSLEILLNEWPSEQIIKLISYIEAQSGRLQITEIGTANKKVSVVELTKASGEKMDSLLPAIELLNKYDELFEINDRAMDKAAKKSFVRILNAMAPGTIQSSINIKDRFSFSSKSSVYTAYKGKYQRLELYHEKGRLLRDFRASFKKYLKEELSAAGEI